MRKLSDEQKYTFFNEIMVKLINYPFLNYLNELYENNKPNENYDIDYDDSFIIPGRIEIKIDDYTAYIDLSSDVLAAIYQIVDIRTEQLISKFEEGVENVDLRSYES